jgi:hypothetical protein
MPAVATTPTVLAPTMGQKVSFIDPLSIKWDWNPNNIKVTTFHLCIGTKEGTWDILNGDVGLVGSFSLILPPLPDSIKHIHIQLLYKKLVIEDKNQKELEEEAFVAGRITVERA